MYKAELSPVPLNFTTKVANEAADLGNGFVDLNGTGAPTDWEVYNGFYSNLKVIF